MTPKTQIFPENKFHITIRQNRVKRNQVTALHLMIGFLLLLIGLVTWSVPTVLKTEKFEFLNSTGLLYSGFGLCLIVISVFFNKRIIQNTGYNLLLRMIEAFVLLSILVYSIIQKWYLPFGYSLAALLVIVFAFLWERKAKSNRIVAVSEQGIFIPGFFKNQILNWQDVSHVILKHAVLTIDCHDNHLYQFSVQNSSPDAASDRFMSFCAEMLESHKHLPRNDW